MTKTNITPEDIYDHLTDIRETLLSSLVRLPKSIRQEASIYVLKTLLIEFEHLPKITNIKN